MAQIFPTVDPRALPDHYDSQAVETRLCEEWERDGIYRFDPGRPREETFVVDTPPPTVSGSLHIGHVFSYTHADIIVRYQRMRGKGIFYPMGWDDNGLPTERRVQNFFHVRCDPQLPYEPGLSLPAPGSLPHGAPVRGVSRKNFIELCRTMTENDERAFRALWERAGLSVDWHQMYATIDETSRRAAQLSFLELFERGELYNREAPTVWDVDFRTAVAQAEMEDRAVAGAFHHVAFAVEGDSRTFTIATTRPELLPACVGVAVHPGDGRWAGLVGRDALTPVFHVPVPIFASDIVDPEKGTGILMVCTFGDSSDVQWWREKGLALRQVIGRDGRFLPVVFGSPGWPSRKPDAANAAYRRLEGKRVAEARRETVLLLRDSSAAASGNEVPLQGEPQPISHQVNFYEKGEHPLEFITTRQWFVRLLDKKEMLREQGNRISWHPDHMRLRYLNWTDNLQFDWCVSRQRFFGVAFPVWYPLDGAGLPDYAHPILAEASRLPVDPMTDAPPGMREEQRGAPGGFVADPDVFDTWFTSSLSPQIVSGWKSDPARHSSLFPMDLRPQAHEIIRTWAFYTIVKSVLHEGTIPWKDIMLSGFIMDPDRKKMSKSKGNVVTPVEFLERYTADGVRYWAGTARLGTDAAFDEKMLKVGKRLVTKLYNAAKFVLSQQGTRHPPREQIDLAFIARLAGCVERATAAFESFDFARALSETETFFWSSFTDSYIELVKGRAKGGGEAPRAGPGQGAATGEDGAGAGQGAAVGAGRAVAPGGEGGAAEGGGSAIATLRLGLSVLLRLFAPFLPFVTEEAWSWIFAAETGWKTIHKSPWPGPGDFEGIPAPARLETFDAAAACLSAVHRLKTQSQVSIGSELPVMRVAAGATTLEALRPALDDVRSAARASRLDLEEDARLPDLAIEVRPVGAEGG